MSADSASAAHSVTSPDDGGIESLSRRQLYDLVWTTPIRKLAREFGLSDVGLAKTCRRYDIPRPPGDPSSCNNPEDQSDKTQRVGTSKGPFNATCDWASPITLGFELLLGILLPRQSSRTAPCRR
jgi:hypothetical protein